MEKTDFSTDIYRKQTANIQRKPQCLYFPLAKHGYTLEEMLNKENRWHTKIVCSIRSNTDFRDYVSTTYAMHDDYLKLIEATTLLKCNNKLSPVIAGIYPSDNTVVCEHIGKFLSSYLANSPEDILPTLVGVFEYMKKINQISGAYRTFIIPSIIRSSLELSEEFPFDFSFLPKTRAVLPKLEKSAHEFLYGCGIEDPHIWNFRIVKSSEKIQALTTDFDYFSDEANCFWELGYFYATLRWLKESCAFLRGESEKILLSLIEKEDLKSEFMFWLGALSSYCGYKDSLRNLVTNKEVVRTELEEQYKTIKWLDEKVSYLAKSLL